MKEAISYEGGYSRIEMGRWERSVREKIAEDEGTKNGNGK